MLKLRIRTYKQSDLDALLRSGYPFAVEKGLLDRLLSILTSKRFVAFVENEVAGTLTVTKYKQKIWEIRYVYTNPSYRRREIASNLLSYAFSFLRRVGARKVILDVLHDNEPAKRLYEKFGFTILTQFFWGEGPIDIELKKDLFLKRCHEGMLVDMYKSCVKDDFIRFFDVKDKFPWLTFIERFDPLFCRLLPIKEAFFRSTTFLREKAEKKIGFIVIRNFLFKEKSPLLVPFVWDKNKKCLAESLFGSSQQILVKRGFKRARLLIFDKNIEYYQDLVNTLRRNGWNIIQEYCMGRSIG